MKFEMTTEMERGAQHVLNTIISAGGQAYFVGGFVRDRILGRPIKDIDIATSLAPETVLQLFPNVIPTGLQHGTVTVRWNKISYEVTTFRTDGVYQDFRRPEHVIFVDNLQEDLLRRDFTINAMAISANGDLIDPFDGLHDIERKSIRCVGQSLARFEEDALRMMRCIRFSVQLGFAIEAETWAALLQLRQNMQYIAMERVRVEFEQMLASPNPVLAIQLLAECGLLETTREKLPYRFEITQRMRLGLHQLNQIQDTNSRWVYWAWLSEMSPQSVKKQLHEMTCSKTHTQLISKSIEGLYEWILIVKTLSINEYDAKENWQRFAIRYGKPISEILIRLFESIKDDSIWFEALHVDWIKSKLLSWTNAIIIWEASELVVRGNELAVHVQRPAGAWLSTMIAELVSQVGIGKLANTTQEIFEFAEKWSETHFHAPSE